MILDNSYEDKEINYLGGVEDITLLNEVSNNLPLLRFNFDENGKI